MLLSLATCHPWKLLSLDEIQEFSSRKAGMPRLSFGFRSLYFHNTFPTDLRSFSSHTNGHSLVGISISWRYYIFTVFNFFGASNVETGWRSIAKNWNCIQIKYSDVRCIIRNYFHYYKFLAFAIYIKLETANLLYTLKLPLRDQFLVLFNFILDNIGISHNSSLKYNVNVIPVTSTKLPGQAGM